MGKLSKGDIHNRWWGGGGSCWCGGSLLPRSLSREENWYSNLSSDSYNRELNEDRRRHRRPRWMSCAACLRLHVWTDQVEAKCPRIVTRKQRIHRSIRTTGKSAAIRSLTTYKSSADYVRYLYLPDIDANATCYCSLNLSAVRLMRSVLP